MIKDIALVLAILLISGCATTVRYEFGTKSLTQDNINKIVRGVTTQTDIISLFGKPINKTSMSTLGVMWTYSHSKCNSIYGPIGGVDRDIEVQALCITFDNNGIVKDFTTSESNPVQEGTVTIMRGSHR